jgi:hypothetical protein
VAKQNEWSKIVTPRIKGNMGESARAAYQNGCALHDDALLLFDGERFPRSAALAILAEEEFSKAFILFISVNQGRWDSDIYKALRQHPQKQGIAEGMRAHFEGCPILVLIELSVQSSRVFALNRRGLALTGMAHGLSGSSSALSYQ